MQTAGARRIEIVEMLLTVGKANVDAKDDFGSTSLMVAVINGQRDIAELLLSVGKADTDAKDKNGSTALTLALRYGHRDVVEMLRLYAERNL